MFFCSIRFAFCNCNLCRSIISLIEIVYVYVFSALFYHFIICSVCCSLFVRSFCSIQFCSLSQCIRVIITGRSTWTDEHSVSIVDVKAYQYTQTISSLCTIGKKNNGSSELHVRWILWRTTTRPEEPPDIV